MIKLQAANSGVRSLLLPVSTVAFMLLSLHSVLAAASAQSGVFLMQGTGYPVCRAIAAAAHRLGPHIKNLDWVTRLPPVRGATPLVWTPVADAASVPSDTFSYPGLVLGPPEETTIPNVVIQTPPIMGTGMSVTVDLHLVRRTMQDDGTGRFSGTKGQRGITRGWSFEAVDLKLFPGVTHVSIGNNLILATVILWGGQPWFTNMSVIGTLDAYPVGAGPEPNSPSLNVSQRCFLSSGTFKPLQ